MGTGAVIISPAASPVQIFDILLAFVFGWCLGLLHGRRRLYDAASLLSNLINFLLGGRIGETLCARVGWNVYVEASPRAFWRYLARVLDAAFLWIEPDHCYAAMLREHPERARPVEGTNP